MNFRNWTGRTVACIASGPSLRPVDCDVVRDAELPSIAVNNAGLPPMASFADIHYACDGRWFEKHPEALTYDRIKVCAVDEAPAGVHKVDLVSGPGFDERPNTIRAGQNSGHQAVHLAASLGATQIILLGYDMQRTGGQSHFHGDHRGGLENPEDGALARWADEQFPVLARELNKRGVDVVNASRVSALTCFRRAALEDVLCVAPS